MSAPFDILITGGTIVDGTGAPRRIADIGIRDGRVAEIGPLADAPTGRVIDARGMIVAPGVIDLHTHYDGQIFWDPYCTASGLHGMTSAVVSNCGFGFAPCKRDPAVQERYMGMMETTEQIPAAALREALPFTWESFPEWLGVVGALPMGVNLGSYVPLNSLMIFVMGSVEDARATDAPTEAEISTMQGLLREAMEAGALGFAFSKLDEFNSHKDHGAPMPTDAADPSTAYRLAEVLRDLDRGVIQALVDLPMAIDHNEIAEELARVSGRPVIQNIIVPFDHIPQEVDRVLDWLDACEAQGLDVYSQALAFRAWNESKVLDWNTWDVVPELAAFSALGDDVEARLAMASDPEWRASLKAKYGPELMTAAGGTLETCKLVDAGCEEYAAFEGWTFDRIAEKEGRHVVDAFFDVVVASRCAMDFRTMQPISQDPELFTRMYKHPRVIAGTSDGGAHLKFYCGGQFSTDLLMWLARDEGRFSLEEMHEKLSLLPAASWASTGAARSCPVGLPTSSSTTWTSSGIPTPTRCSTTSPAGGSDARLPRRGSRRSSSTASSPSRLTVGAPVPHPGTY